MRKRKGSCSLHEVFNTRKEGMMAVGDWVKGGKKGGMHRGSGNIAQP